MDYDLDSIPDYDTGERYNSTPRNLTIEVDPKFINYNTSVLIDNVKKFVEHTSRKYRNAYHAMANGRISGVQALPSSIFTHIVEKEWDIPQFRLQDQQQAQIFLEQNSFTDTTLQSNEMLLIYQLPKNIAQFWNKGGGSQKSSHVGGMVIEWGKYYDQLTPDIWKRKQFSERVDQLNFERVNEKGQHDPNAYYYIWKVKGDYTEIPESSEY